MSEAAQKKLREAHFFLGHLERESFSPAPGPAEAAEFYLSAFLSSARSVTLVLKAERPATYQRWSDAWRCSLPEEERQLLAKFTEARNRAVKRETPVVREDRPASEARNLHASLPAELQFFFESAQSQAVERVLKGRLTPEYAAEEIIPTCHRYVAILSRLVSAFSEAHK